ncbi:MAG: twin-arginine translocase TatA/TatE family subunit [Ilumatobacteraceae bacterium]
MPSGSEWIIVLVIVLLVFGGAQLPKLAKNLGKAQKEFKDGLADGLAENHDSAETAEQRELRELRAEREAARARESKDLS